MMAPSSETLACLVTVDEDKLKQYMKLTEACIERVQRMAFPEPAEACREHGQRMAFPGVSISPKFNYRQCIHLAEKLKVAVESAQSFLVLLLEGVICFPSLEDGANHLEMYKLLYASARKVENFIQNCSKDEWMQAALTMTNVSEYVSSLGFNLELCATVLFGNNKTKWAWTRIEVDKAFKDEVEIVKEKALIDRETLLTKVNALLQTRETTGAEHRLAALLFEILERPRHTLVDHVFPGSSQLSLFGTVARLQQLESLGTGGSATVYKAVWLGTEVAKKTFYGSIFPEFEKEVSILEGLSHPNITTLLCYAKDKEECGECSIVMELMDEDLFSLIQKRRQDAKMRDKTRVFPFTIYEAVDIILQIARGVRYLHEMRIVHRDLKSKNILVRCLKDAALDIGYLVEAKVTDFGISKTKERSMTFSCQSPNMGTTRWMAPEMIKPETFESQTEMANREATVAKYPFKSDVYSFAMVCYEILTGNMPFSNTHNLREVKEMILNRKRPRLPDDCPELLKKLITRCWSPDARLRPRFDDICVELMHLKCLLFMKSVLETIPTSVFNPVQPSPKSCKGEETAPAIPSAVKRKASIPVKWLVVLDFGTTHSGFAYTKSFEGRPDKTTVYYNWACKGDRKPCCKTSTAMYYKSIGPDTYQCTSWGHLAHTHYLADMNLQNVSPGFYLSNFKSLIYQDIRGSSSLATSLPHPLTVSTVITDYLKHIGEFSLRAMANHMGEGVIRDSIQWCVSVPSIWEANGQEQMKAYMVNAGLVSDEEGAELVKYIVKLEAAALYSYQCLVEDFPRGVSLQVNDKILVVDAGAVMVDVVVQEMIGSGRNFKVQEFTKSSSIHCGGSVVDDLFMKFLSRKIECLDEFLRLNEPSRSRLLNGWENIKCAFSYEMMSSTDTKDISLPFKLVAEWATYEKERGLPPRVSYDEVELSKHDLKLIFDPVVDEILRLIGAQLIQVPGIKVMFVVGGFAGSLYLMERIRARFSREVDRIYSPPNPGSAIMQGALMQCAVMKRSLISMERLSSLFKWVLDNVQLFKSSK